MHLWARTLGTGTHPGVTIYFMRRRFKNKVTDERWTEGSDRHNQNGDKTGRRKEIPINTPFGGVKLRSTKNVSKRYKLMDWCVLPSCARARGEIDWRASPGDGFVGFLPALSLTQCWWLRLLVFAWRGQRGDVREKHIFMSRRTSGHRICLSFHHFLDARLF